jgi:hypothetical protein
LRLRRLFRSAPVASAPALPRIHVSQNKIEKCLTGWSKDWPEGFKGDAQSYKPDRKAFPVPELVLATLRDVMGWRYEGPGEKVRWSLYGSILGEPAVFEHRKFGFTITRPAKAKADNKRVEGQLKSAIRLVEKALEPVAKYQVDQGHVTIVNRDHEFRRRYQFFRELAASSYGKAKEKPVVEKPAGEAPGGKPDLSGFTKAINEMIGHNRDGFFYATAMVDSYFSALEHRLVLLRGFYGKPMQAGDLTALLRAKWDEKLVLVADITGNREREELLGRLRRIKERIRNPFAHGGVENDGGSLFFHLPRIGAVPANFSRYGNSIRFSLIPIEEVDFGATCDVFDQIDAIMSSGDLSRPLQVIEAGLDPSFDPESMAHYLGVVSSDDQEFDAHLDHMSDEWSRHANMDY